MNLTEPQAVLGPGQGAYAARPPRRWRATASPARRSSSPTATTTSPEHHPHGPGPAAGRSRRRQRPVAVPDPQDPAARRRRPRRAQRPSLVSLEHKLGINGSPTAVMSLGDNEGALGYLVGEENRGLELMFTMMTRPPGGGSRGHRHRRTRLPGRASAYALERVQGRDLGNEDPDPVAIAHHPDVQRMVMSMKSQTRPAGPWPTRLLPMPTSPSATPIRRSGASTSGWSTCSPRW